MQNNESTASTLAIRELPKGLSKAKAAPKNKAKDLDTLSAQEKRNALSKRASSSFKWALRSMPPARQGEYEAIMSDATGRKAKLLKDFKAKYLTSASWEGAAFDESVNNKWTHEEVDDAAWITFGRLKVVLGVDEAKTAVANEWYPMKAGKKKGQLMIRYDEQKERTTDSVGHDKTVRTTTDVDDDVAQKVLEKLLARSTAADGFRVEDGKMKAASAPMKRPAAQSTSLMLGDKPAAPKKASTKLKGAPSPQLLSQLESTNEAVKNAYTKVTAEKVAMSRDKARLDALTKANPKQKRLMDATIEDLGEAISSAQKHEEHLLLTTSNNRDLASMDANIDMLYAVAEFLAESKEIVGRAKKLK